MPVDVSYESFFGKMGNALCGVCVGFLLIPISFYIIGKNEMNAVCTRKSFDDAKSQMVETACAYTGGNDGSFIHFSCDVNNTGLELESSATNASATAFMMRATSYQYQWRREQKSKSVDNKVGGGTTTYSCSCWTKVWSSSYLNSNPSASACGPDTAQYGLTCATTWGSGVVTTNTQWSGSTVTSGFATETTTAPEINLHSNAQNQYKVLEDQISSISGNLESQTVAYGGFGGPSGWSWDGGVQEFYNSPGGSGSSSNNVIGDRKIKFSATYASKVSAVGTQATSGGVGYLKDQKFGGSTIPPCDQRDVLYFEGGDVSGDDMFENLKEALKALTWILRLVTFLLLFAAFFLIVAPLSVAPDIIPCVGPCIGDLVGSLLCLCSCCTALVVWMFVVGVCWLFARPALGGALVAVGLIIGGVGYYLKKKKEASDGGDTGGTSVQDDTIGQAGDEGEPMV